MLYVASMAAAAAALLIWDLLRGSAIARVATTLLALWLLFFGQFSPYRALRKAAFVPPGERVAYTLWIPTQRATEYQSGVFTYYQIVLDDLAIGRQERTLGLTILILLALTPIARRRVPHSGPEQTVDVRPA